MSAHKFRRGDKAVVSDRPQGAFRRTNGLLQPGTVVTVAHDSADPSEAYVQVPSGWPYAGLRVIQVSALDPVHVNPEPTPEPNPASLRQFTLSLLNALAALSGLPPEEVARVHGRPDFLSEED